MGSADRDVLMRRWAAAFSALTVGALISIGFVSPQEAKAVEISQIGERAFEDVTTCLTSGRDKALNVHYLIDQSGSLSWTDPELARVDILQNSVAELGSFVEQGVAVHVAATGFANGAQQLQDWTPISNRAGAAEMGASLGQSIQQVTQAFAISTDWELGLSTAQQSFEKAPEGCSMLIWFTDGAINPAQRDATESLSALCQPGISPDSLPSGTGPFGLMQEFREAQIPVFGVLLNNEQSSRERYEREYPGESDDRLGLDRWLMSFLRPLVEGIGEIPEELAYGQSFSGGELRCGELDATGFAPPGQANGAFIDAVDPVALAFQFLRIGGQISGGKGVPIIDGTFVVPQGTAGFQVIVSSDEWSLTGPEGSGFSASTAAPGTASVDASGGATKVNVRVGSDEQLVGEWKLDTPAQYAELFLFTGLTLQLDRDRVSTILSDFDNTLTGRVVRTQQFADLPIDLSLYPSSAFSVSVLEDGVLVERSESIEVTPGGQFKIEKFNPGTQSGELQLWLTLSLGQDFQGITSQFDLSIVDKTALATPASDVITLSPLEGPDGVATGSLVITGPNVSDSSTFCIAGDPLRLDDTQAKGDQPVDRLGQFQWSFVGLTPNASSNCVDVGQDEVVTVTIEARNAVQANSAVVSTWQVTSTTEGTAASFDAPITVEFESATQSNAAVEIAAIVLLLLLGLFLPLLVMWLINFVLTRFLPVESVMRASFPVSLETTGLNPRILDNGPGAEGSSITVDPDDFRNVMDQPASREYNPGLGTAKAKIPVFPLAPTWYQWEAPPGHRVLSVFEGGSKHSPQIDSGRAVEISPNMADNWALVIPESELAEEKPQVSGELVVFSRMSNLPDYQKRLGEISTKPGLADRIAALRAAAQSDLGDPGGEDKIFVPDLPSTPEGFTSSPSSETLEGPLKPPKPPTSGPLAPPPPPPS